jgi:hypothetical protein
MSDTGFKYKSTDIVNIFAKDVSSNVVTINNYYTNSEVTKILNNFEVYSNSGGGIPIKINSIGYSIKNIDITNYYYPIYKILSGSVSSTAIEIPSWCNNIAFIIQSAGGLRGSALTFLGGPGTFVQNIYRKASQVNAAGFNGWYRSVNFRALVAGVYSAANYSIKNVVAVVGKTYRKGDLYSKYTTYVAGSGQGGTCYFGNYSITNAVAANFGRATAMTYSSDISSRCVLQFNDSNSSNIIVPNGAQGGNATENGIGTNASNTSPDVIVSGSCISGKTYFGNLTKSGFSQNSVLNADGTYSINTLSNVSFNLQSTIGGNLTNSGAPLNNTNAYFIYYFLP